MNPQRVACIYILGAFTVGQLEGLVEACFRFTPQIAIGQKGLFLEIGACRKLYSEESVWRRLEVLIKRFGLTARIRIADDLPTALALAKFHVATKAELPVDALPIYANPYGESKTFDIAIVLLKNLGVRTLEQFIELPRKSLASRFGKESLLALHYLESAASLPWRYFSPQQKIIETTPIDDAYLVRELEPILFSLRALLDRALLRLRGRGHLALELKIRITQEKYSTVKEPEREWHIELSFAVGSTLSLLSIVRDRLNFDLQRDPLVSAVTQVEVEILKSVAGQGRQTDFFSKKEEEAEQFQAIVSRLIDRLGMDKAFMARAVESYVPENAWQKTFDPAADIQIRLPLRPLRILRKPLALKKIENYFFLTSQARKWCALELFGPERLSGEWWSDAEASLASESHTNERDYYRVVTDSGEELWVYQTVGTHSQYYLHGVFD